MSVSSGLADRPRRRKRGGKTPADGDPRAPRPLPLLPKVPDTHPLSNAITVMMMDLHLTKAQLAEMRADLKELTQRFYDDRRDVWIAIAVVVGAMKGLDFFFPG